MKIFNKTESHPTKVNFIDENNVFVGYDLSQQCCEKATWTISNEILDTEDKLFNVTEENKPNNIENYIFDKNFFKRIGGLKSSNGDDGGLAIFKLVNKVNNNVKYLHIWNAHNGYYDHGFEFMNSKSEIITGRI